MSTSLCNFQDEDMFVARAALMRLEALTAVSATAASDSSFYDSLNRLLEVGTARGTLNTLTP